MPEPLPISLVLKNGSKIHARSSVAIPAPVSDTVSSTYSPRMSSRQALQTSAVLRRCRSVTSILPCSPIASRALIARLSITWCMSVGSMHTGGASGSMCSAIWIPDGKVRARIVFTSLRIPCSAIGLASLSPRRRLNTSIFFTRSRARSPASCMPMRYSITEAP
ncbi:MAG: hypothetical protein HONDAALG_04019 [Gammaproteobacteria bacterium]|nr:hypothetical protein [Gammaproteobacteria bacterium]